MNFLLLKNIDNRLFPSMKVFNKAVSISVRKVASLKK